MKQHVSPKELSRAVGVSESSLKRWADDGVLVAVRTAGGHRRITIEEAVRFIRRQGLRIVDPAALGMPELRAIGDHQADEPGAAHVALVEAMTQGNGPVVRGLILAAYLAGQTAAAIFDHLITPAMHEMGQLWRHDARGIFIEHRATALCIEAINQLRSLLPPPADDAPAAVGGAISGDIYTIPSLMAATVLADGGWRDTNLGADTPASALLIAAQTAKAKLVWLSVSADASGERPARELTHLASELGAANCPLVVGGRAVPATALARHSHVHLAQSMSELAAFAAGLRVAAHDR